MFHLNLLPPNILLDIVKILLNQKSDEYIENICYILKNSGKKLEKVLFKILFKIKNKHVYIKRLHINLLYYKIYLIFIDI